MPDGSAGEPAAGRWLLLLHQIPPQPPYFRAKVRRRLNQLGAVAVKNSVYVLPASDDTYEDFQWLLRQIREDGGEAWLFQADAVEGGADEELEAEFRDARARDYAALAEEARGLLQSLRSLRAAPGDAAPAGIDDALQTLQRLQRKLQHLKGIDFFHAPGREELEILLTEVELMAHTDPTPDEGADAFARDLRALRGRTWVTRAGIKVDRMASAWFIRRFVDSAATFAFVAPGEDVPIGAVRFDMFEGEFTHEGDMCTFEVLLARSGLDDPALKAIGEIVHDIDLKDGRYARPEAAGIAPVLEGITLRHATDEARLTEAAALFDALYARLRDS